MDTKTLENIKIFANDNYSQAKGQHNIRHVERVAKNGLIIAKVLDRDNTIDKKLLEAICYLHDIIMIKKKPNMLLAFYNHLFEKLLNRKHLGSQIIGLGLTDEEFEILSNAIINHPYSIPYHHLNKKNDIYSKILQDADSLDYISKERLKTANRSLKLLSPIIKLYLSIVRRNIKLFLNFPELSQKLSLFEN